MAQTNSNTTALALAFQRIGYRIRKTRTRVRWPRVKGPAGIRVDVKTGQAVGFYGRTA